MRVVRARSFCEGDGDHTCLRICLERLVPAKKDSPLNFNFPQISSLADIPKILGVATAKLGQGEITPSETKMLMDLAETSLKSLEMADFEQRLYALERKANSYFEKERKTGRT